LYCNYYPNNARSHAKKQGCKPTRTAPLSRTSDSNETHHKRIPYPLPHNSISNPAYRHGTLYTPLSPYSSANSLSSPPPHLHFRLLLPARVSPAREKCEPLCGACVPAIFFNHSIGPTPLTAVRASPPGDDKTTIAALASELPILGRFWFTSLPDRYCQLISSLSLSVLDRDGGHQVCAPGYRYVH